VLVELSELAKPEDREQKDHERGFDHPSRRGAHMIDFADVRAEFQDNDDSDQNLTGSAKPGGHDFVEAVDVS
jgi:hypothetical protein